MSDDRDGDPGGLKPEQLRLDARRTAREARASIHTTLTPCPASERCTSVVASTPETLAVTTTVSTARDAGPPSRARSSTTGRAPSASAAASRPSATSQSPSSDETLTLGRDAELTASTARLPWDACERRIEPAALTCSSKLFPATALACASRTTAISSRGASSSSFTISWPRRAVVRQCTFRSDSPCSYSRTEWRSNPDGRRSSSRRPSWACAPLSEKSRSSATSRG